MKKIFQKSVYLFLAFLTLGFLFIPNLITKALSKEIIWIDAGHGGIDGGCVGKNTIEKDIVLDVSIYLERYLTSSGYHVKLTRNSDKQLKATKTLDMQERVRLINKNNTLLFLSIHANTFPSPNVRGAQVFYKKDDHNQLLSNNIQKYLNLTCVGNNRKTKTISDKYLTDNTKQTGCIIEIGFLSNPQDEQYLQEQTKQKEIAYAIYLGVIDYLNSEV